MASSSRRLRAFKRWMKSQGIEYSDTLEFIDCPDQGISVRTLSDLHEGDVVANIPKTACLTIKTSGAREMIESASLDGLLGLSVALMYEKSLDQDSPWAGYLQLLPPQECLPLVWTLGEVDSLLPGTELHKAIKEDKTLMYEDWKENILPLIYSASQSLDPSSFSVEEYFAARSLISSRSFMIDEYHGSGMVPLADLFNHKTGAEDVHFTSVSPNQEYEDDVDSENSDKNELSKISDYDETASTSSENSYIHSDSDLLSMPGEDPMMLQMIMVREVKSGDEEIKLPPRYVGYLRSLKEDILHLIFIRFAIRMSVGIFIWKNKGSGLSWNIARDIIALVFNTYGSLGNAALLHRYGFTEPNNPFDIVNIDLELVLKWGCSLFSSRHCRSRLSLWRRLYLSGSTSEDSEYFEISFDGEPEMELLSLLYIMLLPDDTCHKLDITICTADKVNGNIGMILSEKHDITWDTSSKISKELLLTEKVCDALLALADIRESCYGSNSIDEDMEALKRSCMKERKLYHSLVLRTSERRILEKLRTYATAGALRSRTFQNANKTSTRRKRLKKH
ncbi:ribosomal N-lysine methyltransferase 3-like isoform X2 [Hibiscus syriacus]|uniref:Ribosomal N-lysine methyltransferase 3-like isoform X2 n=1 Tax=Hibiscus syriacus TaxID=106335 RepID=A0A6A3CP96_HIBSY|nr:ribosomal N-lysine methyltransferase 3-like isoform X2 [Hibiscus syriacus]